MLPFATAELDPVTGRARTAPSDTRICEILAQVPDGGPHLWIECRHLHLATGQVRSALARATHLEPEAFRHAGTRDRFSECRRWFSVEAALVEDRQALKQAGYKSQLHVLELKTAARSLTELDVSALEVVSTIHGAGADVRQAQVILDRLRRQGCPNYFSAGLPGEGGRLAKWGRLLAQGRDLPGRVRAKGVDRRRCLAAFQAWLFNGYCATRLTAGLLDRCVEGDLVLTGLNRLPGERRVETVEDVAAMQARLDSHEAVVLGPLHGTGGAQATGAAAAFEQQQLTEMGLTTADCRQLMGGRRAVLFRPAGVQCAVLDDDLEITCRLPVEATVTVLLEELLHPDRHLR